MKKKYYYSIPQLLASSACSSDRTIARLCRLVTSVYVGKTSVKSNQEKGNLGELIMHLLLTSIGAISLMPPISSLTEPTHHGLDGFYVYIINGKIFYLACDAKFNQARLRKTKSGRQLSLSWIDSRLIGKTCSSSRLADAVGASAADSIIKQVSSGEATLLSFVVHVSPDFLISVHIVDMEGKIAVRNIAL